MLRIIVERDSETATVRLAGRLAGPWIEELDRTWNEVTSSVAGDCVLLDLSDVTFVAPEGRRRLESMCKQGARFKTAGCFGKTIVEKIVEGVESPAVTLKPATPGT